MPSSLSQHDHLPCSWRFSPAIGLVLPDGPGNGAGFPVLWAGSVQGGTRICRLSVRLPLKGRRRLRRGRHFRVEFFPSRPNEPGLVWQCRYLGRTSRSGLVTLRGEIL
jgi:hypothetical protein